MGGLLWPQSIFPIQATAPTKTSSINPAVAVTVEGHQLASAIVLVDIYNEDSVSGNYVASLLILRVA